MYFYTLSLFTSALECLYMGSEHCQNMGDLHSIFSLSTSCADAYRGLNLLLLLCFGRTGCANIALLQPHQATGMIVDSLEGVIKRIIYCATNAFSQLRSGCLELQIYKSFHEVIHNTTSWLQFTLQSRETKQNNFVENLNFPIQEYNQRFNGAMEIKSCEKNIHRVMFLLLITDSKPEWQRGSSL